MSNSVWPHRWRPTRLLHPWDFPGKSTGVGCHCPLRVMLNVMYQLGWAIVSRYLVTSWMTPSAFTWVSSTLVHSAHFHMLASIVMWANSLKYVSHYVCVCVRVCVCVYIYKSYWLCFSGEHRLTVPLAKHLCLKQRQWWHFLDQLFLIPFIFN